MTRSRFKKASYVPIRIWALQDEWRRTTRSRYCLQCGKFHDVGAVMHYSVAVIDDHFASGYFCADCESKIEYEKPPWPPDGNKHGLV